jgi:hypothetical protein
MYCRLEWKRGNLDGKGEGKRGRGRWKETWRCDCVGNIALKVDQGRKLLKLKGDIME